MTRETKLGLAVSGSFLCLLGALIGHKLLYKGASSDTSPKQALIAKGKPPAPQNSQNKNSGAKVAAQGDPNILPVSVKQTQTLPKKNSQTFTGLAPISAEHQEPTTMKPPLPPLPNLQGGDGRLPGSGTAVPPLPNNDDDKLSLLMKEKKRLDDRQNPNPSSTGNHSVPSVLPPPLPADIPPVAPVDVAQNTPPIRKPLPNAPALPAIPGPPDAKPDNTGKAPAVPVIPPPPLQNPSTAPKNDGIPPLPPVALPNVKPKIEKTAPKNVSGGPVPPLPPGPPSTPSGIPNLPNANLPDAIPSNDKKSLGTLPNSSVTPPPLPTNNGQNNTEGNRLSPPPVKQPIGLGGDRIPANSGSDSQVKVTDFELQTYKVEPTTLTFDALSEKFYYSKKYAPALLKFNRENGPGSKAIAQNPPRLTVGDMVVIPPTTVLESRYPGDIQNAKPLPATPPIASTPPISIGTQPQKGTNRPITTNRLPPLNVDKRLPKTENKQQWRQSTAGGQGRVYVVQGKGEMLYQIARQTLGDAKRWPEIYRLNPQIVPEYPIPANTRLQLPVNSRVRQ